ncbi:MAG: helix-turn-helix domain-containing protein [Candidatus Cloacimonetes bacterium]|nr:helix-turn-helix domain-containing protein [Candidatus Cloacimonadota bacterium]
MDQKNLGKIIKDRRKSLNINQKSFSEISGIAHHSLSDIESGKGNPTFLTLTKILDILGLKLSIKPKGTG